MKSYLNSVKTYHHGALRPALIAAAESVIAERGLDRFSLRETARRAGVSASAPAHHFGDARGLLTAIAAAAFADLADALQAADDRGGDRAVRIRAQGIAYVEFALRHPARFDLMWRKALLDDADPDYDAAASRAFAMIDRAVRGADARDCGTSDPAVAPSIAAWTMVHGFARLALDGVFGPDPGAAARAADALLPAVLSHLAL